VYHRGIGDDGNEYPYPSRDQRAGTVEAGAATGGNILPEPLPEPGADGPHPQ
jgi:hypothetical protein